jgi:hypothetical protein
MQVKKIKLAVSTGGSFVYPLIKINRRNTNSTVISILQE